MTEKLSNSLSDLIIADRKHDKNYKPIVDVESDNLNEINSIVAIQKRVIDVELNNRTEQHLNDSTHKTSKEIQDDVLHKVNNEIMFNMADKIPESCDVSELGIENARIPKSNKIKMSELLTPVVKIKNSKFDNRISLYENKRSVGVIKKILEDDDVKNKSSVVRELKLKFVPDCLRGQYKKIMYGDIKQQQKPQLDKHDIDPHKPRGLIYDTSVVKAHSSNEISDNEYDDSEDYDSESANAYYHMQDNRKDFKHWLDMGKLTNGNFLMAGGGVSYDGCGGYSVLACKGSGHYYLRNSGLDGGALSMPDMISNAIHDKSGKANIKIIPHQCDRLTCNICYKHAITERAYEIAERVGAGVYIKDTSGSGMKRRIPLHGVVSVSKKSKFDYREFKGIGSSPAGRLKRAKVHLTPFDDLRDPEVVQKVINWIMTELRKIGVEGAGVIFHPFRFSKGLKIPRWSPHFHLIYLGYTNKDDVLKFEKDTPFIFHQVKRKDNFNALTTEGDVQRLASYLLSHAGISQKHHTVRWFGDMQNAKYKTAMIRSKMNTYNNQPLDVVKPIRDILDMDRNIHRIELQFMRPDMPDVNRYDSDFNDMTRSKLLTFSKDSFSKFVDKKTINDLDFDKCFDENVRLNVGLNIDNPAISKSATLEKTSKRDITFEEVGKINVGFYVLSLRYYYLGKHNIEKCGYAVLIFDPDLSNLCPDCMGLLRPAVPINEIVPPDIIEEYEQSKDKDMVHRVSSADYRYVTFEDLSKGLPYCRSDGVIKRLSGIAELSNDYYYLDIHSRIRQYDDYLDSLSRYAMREVKQQLRLSAYIESKKNRSEKLQDYRNRFYLVRAYIMGMDDKSDVSNAWSNSLWSALTLIYTNIDHVKTVKYTKTKSQRLDVFSG